MTHRGPFQPLIFCDSVICKYPGREKIIKASLDSYHSPFLNQHWICPSSHKNEFMEILPSV